MEDEGVLPDHTVLVEEDRIVAMGPVGDIQVPAHARVIDGAGRFLLPGLAEMHGHIPPPSEPAEEIEKTLFLYLANGITTVRGMLGWPGQLDLRDRANADELDAPNLYLAGPSFNGNSVNSPEEAAQRVRAQVEEGWDLLKVHPGLTLAEYDSMAIEAARQGIDFGGHVPAAVGLQHALDMGQLTFDHLDGYVEYLRAAGDDPRALNRIVQRTVDAGAWVVPTMVLWETLYGVHNLDEINQYPELAYVPTSARSSWERQYRQRLADPGFDPVASESWIADRMRVLRALHEAGAGILMGTDAPQQYSVPGFSLHREIRRMEEAGMTPHAVLKTGTVHVGTYFEAWDRFGMVAPGHRADLLLLEANPLDDLAHLQRRAGVMVRGRWIPEAAIQERLRQIAGSYR